MSWFAIFRFCFVSLGFALVLTAGSVAQAQVRIDGPAAAEWEYKGLITGRMLETSFKVKRLEFLTDSSLIYVRTTDEMIFFGYDPFRVQSRVKNSADVKCIVHDKTAYGCGNDVLAAYDVKSGAQIAKTKYAPFPYLLAVNPNGKYVVVLRENGFDVLGTNDLVMIHSITIEKLDLRDFDSIEFAADQPRLMLIVGQRVCRLFDLERGVQLGMFDSSQSIACGFCPSGRSIYEIVTEHELQFRNTLTLDVVSSEELVLPKLPDFASYIFHGGYFLIETDDPLRHLLVSIETPRAQTSIQFPEADAPRTRLSADA